MYKKIGFILTLFVISAFYAIDPYEKPLENILFDKSGYFYLIQGDQYSYNKRIITNPYILEQYKRQLEFKDKDIASTPQFYFYVIKDNKIFKRIYYFELDQIKLGEELENAFENVLMKRLKRLGKAEFIEKTNYFDQNGINWYGDALKKYDGEFTIYVNIKNEIEDTLGWSAISSKIYEDLTSKHPILTNRLDISFSSSSPDDDFCVWKIAIVGNHDFEKTVKSIKFDKIEIVNGSKYRGYKENKYRITYFEKQKK